MRKIVVTEFMSLDGVVEDPGGAEDFVHGGWSFRFNDPDGMKYKLEELQEFDAQLLGRVTYDGFAAAWPERTDEAGFAEKMNAMPKYVVSTTLTDPSWNNTEVLRDLDAVAKLKAEDGPDLLVAGSVSLAQALEAGGLVDEYRLMVHPILLGSGKRLFTDGGGPGTTLELKDSKVLATGTLILTYAPVRG